MIQAVSHSLTLGFAVYSLIVLIAHYFLPETGRQKIARFDYSACQIGALAGFIYLAVSAVDTLSLGRYALPVWIHLLFLLSVQLLWFGKLYKIKWLRLLIALLLLFSATGWFIMITSVYPDYFLSTWSLPFGVQLLLFTTNLLGFLGVSALFHWVKSVSKPKSIRDNDEN